MVCADLPLHTCGYHARFRRLNFRRRIDDRQSERASHSKYCSVMSVDLAVRCILGRACFLAGPARLNGMDEVRMSRMLPLEQLACRFLAVKSASIQ
jgi:hypothetical protein